MSQQCYILLLLCAFLICSIYSTIGISITISAEIDNPDEYNKALVTILEKCNLGLKNIILFDNKSHSTTVDALSVLQPPIARLLKSKLVADIVYFRTKKDPIDTTGLILIINNAEEWSILAENAGLFWDLRNKCTVIVLLKLKNICQFASGTLQHLAHLHYAKSFYICLDSDTNDIVIYTHDPYGDSQPSNWVTGNQFLYAHYNWTLYKRTFREADVCEGFDFNRTDPLKNPVIEIALVEAVGSDKPIMQFTSTNSSVLDISDIKENILAFEKALNMKFIYHVRYERKGFSNNAVNFGLMVGTGVSIIIKDVVSGSRTEFQTLSYPTLYDYYVVISQSRGLATPLEKMVKFYGIWTLISLIFVLGISFIVIVFKTKKNFALATFDTLRLLINSGIVTPLDTFPMRIFFTMIFIYVVVIHATFSGNLAKFLTIPAYLENVDSLRDLADSRVKIVQAFFFIYDEEMENHDIIFNKTSHQQSEELCFDAPIQNSSDVCIGAMNIFRRFMAKKGLYHLHVSNDKLRTLRAHMIYRERSPFIERFDWALMVLSETKIYHHSSDESYRYANWKLRQREESAQIDFRPINLHDIQFAFTLLIIGNSLGLVCFLLEIFISRCDRTKMKFSNFKKIMNFSKRNQNIKVQEMSVRKKKIRVQKITVLPKEQ